VGEQKDFLGRLRVDHADDVGQVQRHPAVGVVERERLGVYFVY